MENTKVIGQPEMRYKKKRFRDIWVLDEFLMFQQTLLLTWINFDPRMDK